MATLSRNLQSRGRCLGDLPLHHLLRNVPATRGVARDIFSCICVHTVVATGNLCRLVAGLRDRTLALKLNTNYLALVWTMSPVTRY